MTSQLNVDTIVDKAGSGGTNIKVGNDATFVSEGGAATSNNAVQGFVKAWAETTANGETLRDSFNVSSLDDTSPGIQTCNYTNVFASGDYACVTTGDTVGSNNTFSATAAGNWIVYSFNGSSYSDMGQGTIAAGDLA